MTLFRKLNSTQGIFRFKVGGEIVGAVGVEVDEEVINRIKYQSQAMS